MPLFLCRWPNGACSVVWAPTKDDATLELDQVGNAEACPMTQVRTFQIHFVLNDQGKLALETFGEGTTEGILAFAYPVLERALLDAYGDGAYESYEDLPPDRRAMIGHAIKSEHARITLDQADRPTPRTELGRDVKKQTDVPTVLVDRITDHIATEKLTHFKGRGKPS